MGLIDLICPQCGQEHTWYSGNLDQKCERCRNLVEHKDTIMTDNNELIEALKTTIAVQNDVIAHLKAEVGRLKAPQVTISPSSITTYPYSPANPYPGIGQQWPYGVTITSVGDPPGSISSGVTSNVIVPTNPIPPSQQSGTTVTFQDSNGNVIPTRNIPFV